MLEIDKRPKVIAVDFDGTIVEHDYPKIGFFVPGAVTTLLELQHAGHRLVLLTMRSGKQLTEAIQVCANRGLLFWAANKNPEQAKWTESPKVFAHLYIDDAALGCPLTTGLHSRPFVDWPRVRDWLFAQKYL